MAVIGAIFNTNWLKYFNKKTSRFSIGNKIILDYTLISK